MSIGYPRLFIFVRSPHGNFIPGEATLAICDMCHFAWLTAMVSISGSMNGVSLKFQGSGDPELYVAAKCPQCENVVTLVDHCDSEIH